MPIFYLTLPQTRMAAAVLSFVFWLVSVSVGDVINRDGILYLQTAEAFCEHGLSQALQLYNWPFYPILIGVIRSGTGIPMEYVAYAINGVCFIVLVDAFIRLYSEFHRDVRLYWVPALVMLAFGGLGSRTEIIRDWGFWGFSILAFFYLLRFDRMLCIKDALFWQLSIFMALLFRVESAVFMVLAPTILLFRNPQSVVPGVAAYFKANCLFVSGACAALAVMGISGKMELLKLKDILTYADLGAGWRTFQGHVDRFASLVLAKYSGNDALPIMAFGVVIASLAALFRNVGAYYTAVLVYGGVNFGMIHGRSVKVVAFLLGIAMMIIAVFFSQKMFLVERYATLASILLLLFVSAYLERLFLSESNKSGNLIIKAAAILLAASLVERLVVTEDSKTHMKIAGHWMMQNLPSDAHIMVNDTRLYYYSGRKVPYGNNLKDGLITPDNAESMLAIGYGYLALRVSAGEQPFKDFLARTKLVALAEFSGRGHEKTIIYKVGN